MPVPVTITKVGRVVLIELVITFDRVLVLAVLGGPERLQESRPASVDYTRWSPHREQIVEGRDAVDGEIFHAKGVRDAELVGHQDGGADIALSIRPGSARRNVVG